MECKKVKELTIRDVVQSALFTANMARVCADAEQWDWRAVDKELTRRGLWPPEKMADLYLQVVGKTESGLSRRERLRVFALGNMAYRKTMRQFIDDESERENSNGDHQ